MAKQSGLGMACYVDGYDLSGDIGSITNIGAPLKTLDVTGIDKSGHERIPGERDGAIDYVAFFNPALAVPGPIGAHPVLSLLPTTDGSVMVVINKVIGGPAACMIGKQINYDPTRGTDGSLTFKVNSQANGFGLEWAQMLTAGIRTDVAATNGTALDNLAASAFGAQAYLEVFGFTGVDATVKLQDSADNITFTDIAGAAFAQITTGNQGQRLALANTATIRRYVRATTITTGGFTSLAFAVALNVNPIMGVAF